MKFYLILPIIVLAQQKSIVESRHKNLLESSPPMQQESVTQTSWENFQENTLYIPELDIALDNSRAFLPDTLNPELEARFDRAFQSMEELVAGSIANPDENRQVGHYWLRNPSLAPKPEIREGIEKALQEIKKLSADILSGKIQGQGGQFHNMLIVGIGGSALGPQFVSQALKKEKTTIKPYFFDNTDPDTFASVLGELREELGQTLVITISKSGSTPETRNGLMEVQQAYREARIDFAKHAVAITTPGSNLDKQAKKENWLAALPLWDWVGGRTSQLSPVGLFPAALEGFDIDAMLEGAKVMDEATSVKDLQSNPAAQLALAWYMNTNGRGEKDMVILPYKDRLALFAKYLQQLVMESLGKAEDLEGKRVHQGIAVYGNKGSTDQHAYIQQLRDGTLNFFATFIEVLEDGSAGKPIYVEDEVTSGDYLQAFLLGTREALYENGRASITLTLRRVDARTVGALIALYERAVGLYAFVVNINAYNQPGVEAGKNAAKHSIYLLKNIVDILKASPGEYFEAEEIADKMGQSDKTEMIFKILEHLSANGYSGVETKEGSTFFKKRFAIKL